MMQFNIANGSERETRKRDIQLKCWMDLEKQTQGQFKRETDRQIDRQVDGQTDIQVDRKIDRQIERQIDIKQTFLVKQDSQKIGKMLNAARFEPDQDG